MNMDSIYRKIAEKHGKTVEEVKQDMQAAIDYSYKNPNKTEDQRIKQESIPYRGQTSTVES